MAADKPVRADLAAVPRPGHGLRLLQGSGEFFGALVEAIDAAKHEVLLETYIFDFTGGAAEVAYALERAARRGVAVRVVVDGFGTPSVPPAWRERLFFAGVEWRVYERLGRLGLLWPGAWRRLHRKLCVVDAATAFCGGINLLDDFHDPNFGKLSAPRFDFAVRVRGPLVAQAHADMTRLWQRMGAMRDLRRARLRGAFFTLRAGSAAASSPGTATPPNGTQDGEAQASHDARAALVMRDNLLNRTRIERTYRRAIARAQHEVTIANAYFVPGRKMRQALVLAAQRGVKVRLLLQGRYEYFMQYYAARPIYGTLLRAGVEIHEYAPSFLHAKVAVIDGHWATVGSSNLDPLSLLLAREANVVVEDPEFTALLAARLEHAIAHEGQRMDAAEYARRPWHGRLLENIALAVMRIALAVQGKRYL